MNAGHGHADNGRGKEMMECFDGNPENRLDLFLLFEEPVRLASDEELLARSEGILTAG